MSISANLTYISFGRTVVGERKNSHTSGNRTRKTCGIFAPALWREGSEYKTDGALNWEPRPLRGEALGNKLARSSVGFLTSRRQRVVRNPLVAVVSTANTRGFVMTKRTSQDESVRLSNFRSYQQDDKVFIFNKDGALYAVYTLVGTDTDFHKKEVLQ